MLGWRKRNDGFEWREYVRTTILVRRKQRRDRIGEAGKAAVDNLKAAGQRGAAAGAEGVVAVGRGAVHLGAQGAALGAAGAKAVGDGVLHYGKEGAKLGAEGAKLGAAAAMAGAERLRAAMPVAGNYLQRMGAWILYALAYTWAVLCTLVGIAADYLGPPLAPIGRILRQPVPRLATLLFGSVALLGGIIRAVADGFVQDTWIVLLIGIGLLGALALAHVSSGFPGWLAAPLSSVLAAVRRTLETASSKPIVQRGLAVGLIALVVVAAGWHVWGAASPTTAKASRQARVEPQSATGSTATDEISGRGSAVTGDTLRIGSTVVRLDGIEAPLLYQTCISAKGSSWSCGDAARQAMAQLLRSDRVSCELSGSEDGVSTGECKVGDRDLAAELVRGGNVFAIHGLFSAYGSLEDEARAEKAGLWVGEAARPAAYRELKWEEAKRAAPDGCPIKATVRGGKRYYVPWARGYEKVRVARRGERWFCSETEAQQAGFKSAEQS